MVYGLHSVQSLLKSAPHRVEELKLLAGRGDQRLQKIQQLAKASQIPLSFLSRKDLDGLVEGNHQGVIALAKPGDTYDEAYLLRLVENAKNPPFILVLDGVTDPHNLGACLRSADAAGVDALVIPKDKAVGLTETARKVACGAADSVPLVPVTNLTRTLKKLQELGLWVVGTSGESDVSLYQAPLTGPLVLVMGAEGKGMRRLTKENCDHLVFIPMAGTVSSLNVSVAAGVCLFEAVRQRSAAG